jgi:DNA (cytosine-5)-methyltransferase 1
MNVQANSLSYLSAGKESKQDVSTPPDLVRWVASRWNIRVDLAATEENRVCEPFLDAEADSLSVSWVDYLRRFGAGWPRPVGWLNPPFGKLAPWMAKSRVEALQGAHTVSLVPASIESGWFAEHIYQGPCTVYVLKGRLKFPGYANVAGQGHCLVDWHGGEWGGIRLLDWRAL